MIQVNKSEPCDPRRRVNKFQISKYCHLQITTNRYARHVMRSPDCLYQGIRISVTKSSEGGGGHMYSKVKGYTFNITVKGASNDLYRNKRTFKLIFGGKDVKQCKFKMHLRLAFSWTTQDPMDNNQSDGRRLLFTFLRNTILDSTTHATKGIISFSNQHLILSVSIFCFQVPLGSPGVSKEKEEEVSSVYSGKKELNRYDLLPIMPLSLNTFCLNCLQQIMEEMFLLLHDI